MNPGRIVGTDKCGCLIYLSDVDGEAEIRTSHQAYCPVGIAEREREREMVDYDPSPTARGTGAMLVVAAAMLLLYLALLGVVYVAVTR